MSKVHSSRFRELDFLGFPGYRIGSDGSVWHRWKHGWMHSRKLCHTWKPMKLSPGSKGYLRVNLVPPGGKTYKTFKVHRLVLTAFIGECPIGMQNRHLNGIKTDNRLSNLGWGTYEENRRDSYEHGGFSRRQHNILYEHDGQTLSLKEWSHRLKINYGLLWSRIHTLKWTFKDAISKPSRLHQPKPYKRPPSYYSEPR